LVPWVIKVLSAVNLDYQPFLETDEIDDVRTQGSLTAKLMLQILSSQCGPQLPFRIGHVLA